MLSYLLLLLAAGLLTAPANAQKAETRSPIQPKPDGVVQLDAEAAAIHGGTARFLALEGLGNICYWTDPADWVSWAVSFEGSGEFVVELKYSCEAGSEGSSFEVSLGEAFWNGQIRAWRQHHPIDE